MSKDMRKSSKQKQKLYIKFLKSKNPEDELIYKNYKNLFEKLRKKSKQNYYSNLLEKHKDNAKQRWQILKEITGKVQKKNQSLPTTLETENRIISDKNAIAEEFNTFFTNIGPNLANKILQISKTFDQYFSPVDTQLNHHDLTLKEFETAYKSLKRNKASGIDDINSNIVLDFFEELKTPLFYIFRASLREGVFPDEMKIAKVSPIFKGGNNLQAENYRPISVLPVFSKILEKIMYSRVYNYFVENKLLFPKQSGFQINTSTEHAILELVRNITKSFEKNEYVLGVFIDLKKAFDTVNHEILLHKLKLYGIHGTCLEWFKSCLSNRNQFIVYNVYNNIKKSVYLDILCGVPRNPSCAHCS